MEDIDITETGVCKMLEDLKAHTATGPDEIRQTRETPDGNLQERKEE